MNVKKDIMNIVWCKYCHYIEEDSDRLVCPKCNTIMELYKMSEE